MIHFKHFQNIRNNRNNFDQKTKLFSKARILYLCAFIVIILLYIGLNITFSMFTSVKIEEAANIKVGNMYYSLMINGKLDTMIISNPNNINTSNIIISSLNDIDSKYELIYKVCLDKECKEVIDKPAGIEIEYSSKTIDSVTGMILTKEQKIVRIIVINNTDTTYYIKLGINAGYAHNTLALQNLITNVYNENDLTVLAYVNGEASTSFPADDNYVASISCNVDNEETTAIATVSWDGSKWVVNVSNVTTGRTICNVIFGDPPLYLDLPIDLPSGMIPVTYNASGQTIKADQLKKNGSWYDYSQYKWANAVLVNDASRSKYQNASPGSEILQSDILAYYVWIPRFSYTLFNTNDSGNTSVNEQLIEVTLQTKENEVFQGTKNGEELTHPAFWWDKDDDNVREEGEELNGFWIGKFELTGSDSAPTIKPNLPSQRFMVISTAWTIIRKFQENPGYGINNEPNIDSHLIKNMEWGAVGYLSHSKYGNRGNPVTGVEFYINPSESLLTGRGGKIPGAAAEADQTGKGDTSLYGWTGKQCNTKNGNECTGTIQSVYGMAASTTGTIYGVYDMSGGSYEHVMANMASSSENYINRVMNPRNSGVAFGSYTDVTLPKRYFDIYDYGTTYNDAEAYKRGKLGDGTKEVFASSGKSWNNDATTFMYSTYPWLHRGGLYGHGGSAGIWNYTNTAGGSMGTLSSRAILLIAN